MTLGRREFSVTEERFAAYMEDIANEGRRAKKRRFLATPRGHSAGSSICV